MNLWLCAACLILNIWQYRVVGSVREAGMLICAAWMLQEALWWSHIDSSAQLTVGALCDLLIALYVLTYVASDKTDRIIIALLPATLACGLYAEWRGGHTTASWWLGWALVTAQMLIGLPRPKLQRSLKDYTHGPMRPVKGFNRGV